MHSTPASPTALDLSAIAKRIRSAISDSGMDATSFSARIGIPYGTVRAYTSALRPPGPEFLAAVSSEFGLSADWVLTGSGHMRPGATPGAQIQAQAQSAGLDADFALVPMFDVAASAGPGAAVAEPPGTFSVQGLCFARAWLSKRGLSQAGLRVITVRGASMEPVLSDGDRVLIDTSDTGPRSGYVYVLRQADELLVKYCQLLPGGVLRVSSANPAYQAYDVDLSRVQDVEIVGRVVASMHEW